ncbi:PASTA domain-containing protein [Amycolatopsis keratiniphila]|uniref:PASTA domain-containing protein n=1 Tax=Amycolatopsis keratiniphila TaxID=129921 RepID=UPI0033C28177
MATTGVRVPELVGLSVPDARMVAHQLGIVVASKDLDGPSLGALTWPGTWVVVAQEPACGAVVARGGYVRIEFRRLPDEGGGAGDREPRDPLPRPQAIEEAAEPTKERREPHPGRRVR